MAPGTEVDTRETATAKIFADSLAELMAHASHDLIGPLNRAASLLDILIRRYRNQMDAEADRVLDFLLTSSARMEEVAAGVTQYLELTRHPGEFVSVDLNESLATALARLKRAIGESGAVVEADRLPAVSANSAQMIAIFELLIANSIRFRSPDRTSHIRIWCVSAANMHDIAVADNGIGIDPQYAEAVFEPFRRLNGAQYPGPGLGLTKAKLIAELHGGAMRIEQPQDCGIRVHFTLPTRH